jgi:pilus assembly protein CpaC
MYAILNPRKLAVISPLTFVALVSTAVLSFQGNVAQAQPQVIRNITQASERLELTVNTSRILTLDKRIPRMVVNNPELVTVTPISANQVQLAARKPGVTQVNLWDEDDQVYTVDVLIYGDVRELELALHKLFPESSVKVVRLTNSLVLEGYVERPEVVSPIVRLAEDYAPKVVNNITVGGVQQILLKVKVMEVSRTKLRNLGVNWAIGGGGGGVITDLSGLLTDWSINSGGTAGTALVGQTNVAFGVFDDDNAILGFIRALQENKVAKVLADPSITTVSGRPARFNVGGEFPIIIPSGLGQSTIEFKPFGTEVNFVPIVLGNGNIRLEVRPRVSERDDAGGVQQNGFTVPALRVREVDTGVELKAGQTLALAGLVQTRIEASERGIPYVSNIPYVGALFRDVREVQNEIELLIMVTPEFVDGMEPCEVPPCGPGMESFSPTDCQLYFGGHLEVPSCGPCAPNGCVTNCATAYNPVQQPGGYVMSSDSLQNYGPAPAPLPVEVYQGGQEVQAPQQDHGQQGYSQPQYNEPQSSEPQYSEPQYSNPAYDNVGEGQPVDIPAPVQSTLPQPPAPPVQTLPPQGSVEQESDSSAIRFPSPWQQSKPVAEYNRQAPQTPNLNQPVRSATSTPGLIGPIGYDMEK